LPDRSTPTLLTKKFTAYNTGFALSGLFVLILICTFMRALVRGTYSRFLSPTQTQSLRTLADTLKTTVQTKTVDNLDSKTEIKRHKNRKFA
jgi:hypothetical protein